MPTLNTPERLNRPHVRNYNRPLAVSRATDVARAPYQSYTPAPARRPLGVGGYSAAVLDMYGAEAIHKLLRN